MFGLYGGIIPRGAWYGKFVLFCYQKALTARGKLPRGLWVPFSCDEAACIQKSS